MFKLLCSYCKCLHLYCCLLLDYYYYYYYYSFEVYAVFQPRNVHNKTRLNEKAVTVASQRKYVKEMKQIVKKISSENQQ